MNLTTNVMVAMGYSVESRVDLVTLEYLSKSFSERMMFVLEDSTSEARSIQEVAVHVYEDSRASR